MPVRTIALAFPLALAIACASSRSSHTGAMWPEKDTAGSAPIATSTPTSTETATSTSTETTTAASTETATEAATATSDDTSTASSTDSSGGMGSSGDASATGAAATADTNGGGEARTVSGRVAKVSKESVTIRSKSGETQILKLSPDTVITLNGKDARRAQLRRGQQVQATVGEGDDMVARVIDARSPPRAARRTSFTPQQ